MWVTVMQNMLPPLGAGVIEHSTVTYEPIQRANRSLYPILGVVYDGPRALQTARQIVSYHRTIKGNGYNALDDDTFYWAHAVFFMQVLITAELFFGPLTHEQKCQLYAEHVQWYAQYGKGIDPVPPTWEAFQWYWRETIDQKLMAHPAAITVLTMPTPKPPTMPVPDFIWKRLAPMLAEGQRWVATGCFDAVIRKKLDLDWAWTDELLLKGYAKAVRQVFKLVPERLRWHPRALAGWRRERGRYLTPPPEPHRAVASPTPGPQHHPAPADGSLVAYTLTELMAIIMLAWAGAASQVARCVRVIA